MKLKPKVLLIVLIFLLTIQLSFADPSLPSDWAKEIIALSQKTNLLDQRLFGAYQTEISRSEFAYLLVKLYETLTDECISDHSTPFSDTSDPFVIKAQSAGLIAGYLDGTFRPDAPIRRDELAAMLLNLIKKGAFPHQPASKQQYSDHYQIPYWARESIYIARSNQLLSGTGQNQFEPDGSLTREQALTLFVNTLKQFETNWMPKASYRPVRIVLTPGQTLPSVVNFSWQNHADLKANYIRIAQGHQLTASTADYAIYKASHKTIQTKLYKKNYQFSRFHVSVSHLEPSTTYTYQVGDGVNWSEAVSFKTLPSDSSLTIGFFGDIQGYTPNQYAAFEDTFSKASAFSEGFDLSLFAGDVVDTSTRFEEWQFLDDAMDIHFKNHFFAAALGNHDNYDEGSVFTATFNNPDNGVKGLENRNYWFETNNVTIAVWDTETPSLFTEQSAWLKQLMEQSNAPFKIVLMHRSAYPMQYNETHIRKLATVFEEADIDLVLSGHDHIYSRTSMRNGALTTPLQGVTYVCGGSSSGSKYYTESTSPKRYWRNVVYDHNTPVFGVLEIHNNSLEFNAYAVNGARIEPIDSFRIMR